MRSLFSTGEDVELSTSTTYQYTLLTQYGYVFTPSPQANCITFQVKACHDAHIGLFESEDDLVNRYNVVIGGWINTRTVIQTSLSLDDIIIGHEEDGVISCDEYRYFWISWRNDGEVVLGRGEVVFQDVLLTARDDEYLYQVRFVGISTGFGSSGKWKFPRLLVWVYDQVLVGLLTSVDTPDVLTAFVYSPGTVI
ncbi:C3 and PZP-like alpha-2-macroglobulin domain-containing protein 8 [Mizuhopecten yessoensis]|uniref:C3 and PZP-like alpha-2-macroglobulin domain-containing protein 8 n=1 Tax=Mizuhopecten yessoensis TaxID=6573 RepID=A0A210Q8M4_MIZYE|nr:C3 and PZP-like alpha-2-macroglobulin domain-containing protein 8 [Mizuhopecten yessoensis]